MLSPRPKRRRSRQLHVQPLERRMLLHAAGVISGAVFFDNDGDGNRSAAESGVPGAVVDLTANDSSRNQSVITDDNGNFRFDELDPGDYQVIKRQLRAIAGTTDAAILSLTLEDDQIIDGNNLAQNAIRPEFININWFFASSPSSSAVVREAIAFGEELDGNAELADLVRAGGGDVPEDLNNPPVANGDTYEVDSNDVLDVDADTGVLANDTDNDDDTITAELISQPSNGSITFNADGSFTYTPNTDFVGIDSFTYQAGDGQANSAVATATITVNDATSANQIPQAANDSYEVDENESLTVNADDGVLANDTDADGDSLTASIIDLPSNGDVTLNADGSFTYAADSEFFGDDSFTYVASDGAATSNEATVSIAVRPVDDGSPFATVTPGSFTDANLLGVRTDLVSGAPSITANHVNGDVDYSSHSNPPTYGDHHPFDPDGSDSNPGITPRATGIYTNEQPDEDLIHNLEHGHVWISYDPSLLSSADVAALEQLVRDGAGNAQGSGVGVILTPRAANDQAIALASWAHLQTLDRYDPSAIRAFINTNRGKAPEGFITP